MRIVIIGAGAAGISAAETIRKYSTDSEITVISKEPFLPFSPVGLPEYIEGKISRQQLLLWDEKFIQEKRINLILGKAAVKVYPKEQRIAMDNDSSLSYDRLLIASGASPILPEDFGNRRGVFKLRSLEDAEAIRSQIKKRAIIYGAGAVAIKIAVALRRLGIDVILLCRSRPLRRLFDEDISRLISDLLSSNGVEIVQVSDYARLIGDPVERLSIGIQEFKCDGVIAALGVTPNTSFLNGQMVRLGALGGIIVDEKMCTSAKNIYAAGDCAETKDITSGESYVMALWPPAVEQGRVAALNMMGTEATYQGTLPGNVIDVFGMPLASIGSLNGKKINTGRKGKIIRFTYNNIGKVIGCQLVGDVNHLGLISSYIKKGGDVDDLERLWLVSTGRLLSTRLFRQECTTAHIQDEERISAPNEQNL